MESSMIALKQPSLNEQLDFDQLILKPLYTCNEYIIGNTQDFSKLNQEQSPLQLDKEYVSYDRESLFTNVSITETNKYILDEIYVHNKLLKLCSRLIFIRLLLKLTTKSAEMFNSKFESSLMVAP